MRKLNICWVVCCWGSLAFAEERLIDMVYGSEIAILKIVEQPGSTVHRVATETSRADAASWLKLLMSEDYEATLISSRRGVVYTHKDANTKILLVRTRYTGEREYVWSVMMVPKGVDGQGLKVRHYTIGDHNTAQFSELLYSVVP
jgi:hypothetical protein